MAQLSDDCFAHGGRLMRTQEALDLLAERLERVTESETLPLTMALGRILAEDLVAEHSIPPADNAAVDGYAVYFDDLDGAAETRLPVRGRAAAGRPLEGSARRGEAVRIFTGAPMPEGPDTVMMQEDCQVEADCVTLRPGIKRGANRRRSGEDVRSGEVVLTRGQRLRPQDLGLAASVGRRALRVSAPLKVALFSTGDELIEPGDRLRPSEIYDSNRFTLHGLLAGLGCDVSDLGILPDRQQVIQLSLAQAAVEHDLVITSGGVSVGEEDHVKAAVEQLGQLHAWRLAIKPGRPVALGQISSVPFIGLPGNPVAVMVTFLTVVRPAILRLVGARDLEPHHFKVEAGFDYRKKKDRREWLRVRLVPAGGPGGGLGGDGDGRGGWRAEKYPRDGAGILSSLVAADGLVVLPEDLTDLKRGTMVDFLPFSEVVT